MSKSSSVCRSMHSTSAAATKLRPVTSCLFPPALLPPTQRSHRARCEPPRLSSPSLTFYGASQEQLRTFFVDALVRAGSCRHGRVPTRTQLRGGRKNFERRESTVALQDKNERQIQVQGLDERSSIHRRRQLAELRGARIESFKPYSRGDYYGLVDFYGGAVIGEAGEFVPAAQKPEDEMVGLAPVTLSEAKLQSKQELTPQPQHRSEREHDSLVGWTETYTPVRENDDSPEPGIAECRAKLEALLVNERSSPEAIYNAYKRLPSPGVRYLDREERIYLLKRLSKVDHKNTDRTLQFFSVLDDYKAAKLKIPRYMWNTAISLGGRTLHQVTDAEVEIALRTWKEMEQENGVKSNQVTFNILFDIAAKAGKYALAEMILQEMRARGFEFSRFTRVGMIYYQGLRKDGEGVREAYRQFVEQGEIVDTMVLNCVVAALTEAGEPDAAEAVCRRMMVLAAEREGAIHEPHPSSGGGNRGRKVGSHQQNNFRRLLAFVLKGSARARPHNVRQLQQQASVAPDVRTVNTLLSHHCATGELHRAVRLLEDMGRLRIAPDNRTFRCLFEAFARHGGQRYSTWTAPRLQHVWDAYAAAVDKAAAAAASSSGPGSGLLVTKWAAIWAERAFRRCFDEHRAQERSAELRRRWTLELPYDEAVLGGQHWDRPLAPPSALEVE